MRLLRAVDRTRPDGMKTMESAIRASYDALTPSDKSVFRQLCAFPASFSIELAEALVGSDQQDSLDRLVEGSMLFVVSSTDDIRYGMYEVIRQFGGSCLEDLGESESTHLQFISVIFALTKQAAPMMATNHRPFWLKKLTLERDNWQKALQACKDGNTFAEGVFSLAGYWAVATQGRETAFWLRQILLRKETIAAPLVARAVAGLGIFYWEQCDAENANRYSEEAMILARAQEDRAVLARALNTRGLVLRLVGRYEEAYVLATEALEVATEIGNEGFMTTFRGNVGRCATFCGRYAEGLEHLSAVRDTYIERGLPREAAALTYAMAWNYSSSGNTPRALELYAESLPVFLVENADIYLGWALHDFLLMCLAHGDDAASVHIFGAIRMIERTSQTKIYYSVDGESESKLRGVKERLGESEWKRIMNLTHEWDLQKCVDYALSWTPPPEN